jgi:hypothetical protein
VDDRRFDDLARSLASPSRRSLLKIAAAAGLGLATRFAPAAAGAQDVAPAANNSCKKSGANCSKDTDCCSKTCKNGNCKCGNSGDSCSKDNDCCSGSCKNGNCKCGKSGDSCDKDKDCCNNLSCKNGNCK